MLLIRYTLITILLYLLAALPAVHAQCTTDAGTISGGGLYCEGATISINNMANETLDGNDILIFVVYTGGTPNATNVLAVSSTVNFPYQSSFLNNSPVFVAAVAGNDAGNGSVDWNDPCLSVSTALTVVFMPPPTVTVNQPVLTCLTPSVVLNATGNQQGLTYGWSGPGNFNSTVQNPTVVQPGSYCVTVTNPAGCSTIQCTTVTSNIDIPIADPGPPQILNCFTPQVTLNGGNSSVGPNIIYLWTGPGISPANQTTLNPTVNLPGVYSLIVTNVINGCTSVAQTIVNFDAAVPSVDAGPDTGIPCGGGTVTLLAATSGGGQVTYNWNGPAILNGATTLSPEVDAPGTYTIIVTNTVNGCTSSDAVTVFPGPAIPQQDFIVTNTVCFGESNGAINTTISVGQSPFATEWTGPNAFLSNAEDIGNLPAGTYSIAATDNTGCTYYANVKVGGSQSPITATATVNNTCENNNGVISIQISGGTPPYLVQWSNGFFGPVTQGGLAAGVYTVTVIDASGCAFVLTPITVAALPPALVTSQVSSSDCSSNGSIVLNEVPSGTPMAYQWTGPGNFSSNTPIIANLASGFYTVVATNLLSGCTAIYSFDIQNTASGNCSYLTGNVIRDTSENCVADSGEPGLGGWLVRAVSTTDTLYGVTNASGTYFIAVPLGDYLVTAIQPNSLWELCPPGALVSVNITDDTFPAGDIPVKKVVDCPALSVSIGTNQLRRCFSNNYYYLDYCNDGTEAAEDAYILVTLDPFLSPIAASLPYTSLGNNILRFDVGNLAPGDCGSFSIQVQVSCSAVLGQTHCTEAHIFPDSICLPPDPLWSGASLKLSSQCNGDSVHFTVKNIGLGDMSDIVDYVIIEDAVMLMIGSLQLDAGDSTTFNVPANGSTWRLEVAQAAFHPGNSQPSAFVEGCSNNPAFSTGYVTQYSLNDADPWLDIDCTANIGSYDPNDKQGFPVGYGPAHYIRPGTEIEYLIRFQNTGTDTAFTVRVVDTLSAWLDPTSIRPGAGSHAYQFNLSGPGIVEFLFDNILLPDSNVNQTASNGFVKFSILPRADAPLETVIENQAAIFFDFNDPVITNTTFHRLGENFILHAWHPFVPGAAVSVMPNPFSEEAMLTVKGLSNNAPLQLRVFDLRGMPVGEMESDNAVFNLKKGNWPAGVYLFQIAQNGQLVGSGKLSVN